MNFLKIFWSSKDEITKFRRKSAFSLGDECKIGKYFLISLLIDGKLELNVSTKGRIFLEFLLFAQGIHF